MLPCLSGCLAGLPIHDGIQSHAAVSPVSAVERHFKPPASAVFAAVRAAATRWPPLNTAGAGAAMALGQRLSASETAKQWGLEGGPLGGLRPGAGGLWTAIAATDAHTSPLRDSEGYR